MATAPVKETPSTTDAKTDRPTEEAVLPGVGSEEFEGASLPQRAKGDDPVYARPYGTRVSKRTLRYRSRGGKVGRGFDKVYDEESQSTYYHSGVNRGVFIEWIAQENEAVDGVEMGAMVNARSAAQPGLLNAYAQHEEVPLTLDCGAFQSGGLSVAEYVAVLQSIDEGLRRRGAVGVFKRFDWAANLDVLNEGSIGTGPHFFSLREEGIEPLWIGHVRQEPRGYKVKFDPPPELTFELRPGMTIGIGGLVPLIRSDHSLALKVIERTGKQLAERQLRGHFFGCGSEAILSRFGSEPWFESADSSKWLAGQKARKIYRKDGNSIQAERHGLAFDRKECARQNLRQITRWMANRKRQMTMSF